jgi:transcriptional regulator with XRE-family HTH domain
MLASNLKRAREAAGLTQVVLAEKAGVPLRTYQNWEAGNRRPRLDTLVHIARVLGVTTDALLTGQPDQPKGKGRK